MMSGGILAIKKHISKLTVKSSLMTVIGGLNKEHCLNVDSEELKLKDLIIDPVAYTPRGVYFNGVIQVLMLNVNDNVDTNNRLFEISFMPTSGFSPDIRSKFKSELENSLGNYDLVIVADFGHGLIDNEIASLICKKAST